MLRRLGSGHTHDENSMFYVVRAWQYLTSAAKRTTTFSTAEAYISYTICSGPTADGLASPTKMKTFWVIKYLNNYLFYQQTMCTKKMLIYT